MSQHILYSYGEAQVTPSWGFCNASKVKIDNHNKRPTVCASTVIVRDLDLPSVKEETKEHVTYQRPRQTTSVHR